jgi:hypothetical protein
LSTGKVYPDKDVSFLAEELANIMTQHPELIGKGLYADLHGEHIRITGFEVADVTDGCEGCDDPQCGVGGPFASEYDEWCEEYLQGTPEPDSRLRALDACRAELYRRGIDVLDKDWDAIIKTEGLHQLLVAKLGSTSG